jgi:hypothetical protein
MKSNIVIIDNQGHGYDEAILETKKVSEYNGLDYKNSIRLQLCAEELLSMARSITGEIKASFWIENEQAQYELHLATETVMDKEKRDLLIAASSSRKNEAADSFLGKLRNMFESAMAGSPDHSDDVPDDALSDLANHTIECTDEEWDGYEQSTLRRLADTIKIGIRGDKVEMTVIKSFA